MDIDENVAAAVEDDGSFIKVVSKISKASYPGIVAELNAIPVRNRARRLLGLAVMGLMAKRLMNNSVPMASVPMQVAAVPSPQPPSPPSSAQSVTGPAPALDAIPSDAQENSAPVLGLAHTATSA